MKELIKPEVLSQGDNELYDALCELTICGCKGKDRTGCGSNFFADEDKDEIIF